MKNLKKKNKKYPTTLPIRIYEHFCYEALVLWPLTMTVNADKHMILTICVPLFFNV